MSFFISPNITENFHVFFFQLINFQTFRFRFLKNKQKKKMKIFYQFFNIEGKVIPTNIISNKQVCEIYELIL